MNDFNVEIKERLIAAGTNVRLKHASNEFMKASIEASYSYNYHWLGRPIIQYPQDIVAMQELIWQIRPDVIVETGIAHGGSLILSASMMAMLDYCDAVESGDSLDPQASKRKVIGVDIDIRAHNKVAIENHPMRNLISMIEGSSLDSRIIEQVKHKVGNAEKVLVALDSNHTHEHVLAELDSYAPLVTLGSYCVVFDTVIEQLPADTYDDRPWGIGNNPMTAVNAWLPHNPAFEVDRDMDQKLQVSVAPGGFLKRVLA